MQVGAVEKVRSKIKASSYESSSVSNVRKCSFDRGMLLVKKERERRVKGARAHSSPAGNQRIVQL